MTSRGQAAFEFIILTGFMLLMFSLFFLVINERTALENRKAFELELSIVTDVIRQEVILANQVHEGYERVFELPLRIDGEQYTIRLEPPLNPSEIIVNTSEYEYVVFLPFNLSSGSSIAAGSNRISKPNETSIKIVKLGS